jgi:hypothetical protein
MLMVEGFSSFAALQIRPPLLLSIQMAGAVFHRGPAFSGREFE